MKYLLIILAIITVLFLIGFTWGEHIQSINDDKANITRIAVLNKQIETYKKLSNLYDCSKNLNSNASADDIITHYNNCSPPTPTPIARQINISTYSSNSNTFTCVDPTVLGYKVAPCIVSNASNGICEDTSNGAVFSCTSATRLSNTYPPPTQQPAPTGETLDQSLINVSQGK